jgi:hypothetical protein
MTAWNDFVKKIYHEGHDSNPNYQFKQALKDASKRKSEMGSSSSSRPSKKMSRKSRKSCMKSCKKSCRSGRKMRGGVGNGASPLEVLHGKVGGTRRRRRKH